MESIQTPQTVKNSGNESEDDNSDHLEIDLGDTSVKQTYTTDDFQIIETIEDEIGKKLNEKAEKTNLTVTNVKTIIRQVLTNEHVMALLNKEGKTDNIFEPKLTRAKTKELLSSTVIAPVPWVPQPPPSETHVLVGEDLQEDSSGDEYIPGEESEEDKDDSVASESETSSLPPSTPPAVVSMEDSSTQTTNWTEDGIFKIPKSKAILTQEEEANIALRTRSKINLSATPLEVIEKSFVPPDITKDMYDMDCDDDDWKEFLKGFTEPLDEVTKATEDEEHDPEYNILADDEIDQIEREEFREDKAVKITKKEIKELWEELFEYIQNISEDHDEAGEKSLQEAEYQEKVNFGVNNLNHTTQYNISQGSMLPYENIVQNNDTGQQNSAQHLTECSTVKAKTPEIIVSHNQLCMIEQQMRQHVQILTQNFLLMYDHPELHENCVQLKEYLLNLKFLSEGKTFSLFKPINLEPALQLIDYWVELFTMNGDEVKETKAHVRAELSKSLQYKMAGNYNHISTFPKLVLKTISNSEVFLYPFLLPKIPYKSLQFVGKGFTESEDDLIVMGLEQFSVLLKEQSRKLLNKFGEIPLKLLASYIHEYMMPHRDATTILKHILQSKHPRNATNPIQTYFVYKRIKPVVHYIYPLNQILPPSRRNPDELPLQWREYLFPSPKIELCSPSTHVLNNTFTQQLILINNTPFIATSPVGLQLNAATTPRKKRTPSKRGQKNKLFSNKLKEYQKSKNVVTTIEKFAAIFARAVDVQRLIRFCMEHSHRSIIATPNEMSRLNSLPNMPFLSTSAETHKSEDAALQDGCVSSTLNPTGAVSSESPKQEHKIRKTGPLDFSNISFHQDDISTEVEFSQTLNNFQISQTSLNASFSLASQSDSVKESVLEKDNPEDIKNLLVASSTIKPVAKKEPSGAEKKKAKLRREFLANLSIASPEDAESVKSKDEMFAIAYYDKLRETLDLEDYHKIMQILNEFENGDAVDLYWQIEPILKPKYSELVEEFLLFLSEKEAALVGQLIPWFMVTTRVKFLRKLEIYFKDQPAQLRKIYNLLTELSQSDNLSMEKIKSSILPLLKGNGILTDLFLQNFMEERPPASLLQGPYETIDINKEMARREDEELYETIVVPNTEDKYGGVSCDCHCHKIEDNEYKCRYKHCISCGLRFVQGKVFIQTGRGMQPASITFKTNPKANHTVRLLGKPATPSANQRKRRADSSPNKHTSSSGKENVDEDTEDEDLGKRTSKSTPKPSRKRRKGTDTPNSPQKPASPKKSPVRRCDSSEVPKDPKPRRRSTSVRKRKIESKKTRNKVENAVESKDKNVTMKSPEKVIMVQEKLVEAESSSPNTTDNKCETRESDSLKSPLEPQPGTSRDFDYTRDRQSTEKSLTPGQHTAESESEFCEESSQDNYESDSSCSSLASNNQSQSDSNTNDERPWQREEDTVILETFQREDDKDYALQIICDKLPNRTISQIRSRFSTLMTLLIESLKSS